MSGDNQSVGKTITLVFKAIAVAMSVAAVVLNILGVAPIETQVLLLGFGLFALAVTALE
jgi:hypothetical protein